MHYEKLLCDCCFSRPQLYVRDKSCTFTLLIDGVELLMLQVSDFS